MLAESTLAQMFWEWVAPILGLIAIGWFVLKMIDEPGLTGHEIDNTMFKDAQGNTRQRFQGDGKVDGYDEYYDDV
jgi:hypothetical protein